MKSTTNLCRCKKPAGKVYCSTCRKLLFIPVPGAVPDEFATELNEIQRQRLNNLAKWKHKHVWGFIPADHHYTCEAIDHVWRKVNEGSYDGSQPFEGWLTATVNNLWFELELERTGKVRRKPRKDEFDLDNPESLKSKVVTRQVSADTPGSEFSLGEQAIAWWQQSDARQAEAAAEQARRERAYGFHGFLKTFLVEPEMAFDVYFYRIGYKKKPAEIMEILDISRRAYEELRTQGKKTASALKLVHMATWVEADYPEPPISLEQLKLTINDLAVSEVLERIEMPYPQSPTAEELAAINAAIDAVEQINEVGDGGP